MIDEIPRDPVVISYYPTLETAKRAETLIISRRKQCVKNSLLEGHRLHSEPCTRNIRILTRGMRAESALRVMPLLTVGAIDLDQT